MVEEVTKRYRINRSQTSTGKRGYECTVELEGDNLSMDAVLLESDILVAELDKRYPPPVEEKKEKN